MILYKHGNILEQNAEAIVNTVNCVGVMGRGIALQFKNRYPDNFKKYLKACQRNEVCPGKMFIFETGNKLGLRYIINFPTKRHWREKSKIKDIELGLKHLYEVVLEYNIKSIAIPPLGSGLGGLDWSIVKSLIELTFEPLSEREIIIYEPIDNRISISKSSHKPSMTPGRAALIGLIDTYLKGLLDPFVTLLEIHKLMYFMQEAGQVLRLNYKKASYGPYAENLRHVLKAIEGYFIQGYLDGGDNPNKQIEVMPNAVNQAFHFLNQHPETQERFNSVVNLVEGFESPFGLELLSTVHWIMKHESVFLESNLIEKIYAWNKRKKQFTERQIKLARQVLIEKNWV